MLLWLILASPAGIAVRAGEDGRRSRRALDEFTNRNELSSAPLELRAGPIVQHLSPRRVVISWESKTPGNCSVECAAAGSPPAEVAGNHEGTAHWFTLSGLEPEQQYRFRIRTSDPKNGQRLSPFYRFDSACDLVRCDLTGLASPYPDDDPKREVARIAKRIAEQTGVDRGYGLLLGCGDGHLAWELARQTNLQIVAVEPDAEKAAAARRRLDQAGVYGVRIVVHHGPLDRLPYANGFANLIVSHRTLQSGKLPPSVAEVCRVLRPYGGVAWIGQAAGLAHSGNRLSRSELEAWLQQSPLPGWQIRDDPGVFAVLRRGAVPGAGRWTHLYADAGNSACSGDRLRAPLQIQWFGRPGPRQMVDRHHRGMAPLSVGGRLFVVGNDRLKAVDAYNGAPLWDLTIPKSRRVCVHRNSGHVVAAEDLVYVAVEGTCRAIDVATGRSIATFHVPDEPAELRSEWGYLACADDRLFGSATKAGASYSDHSRQVSANYSHWDDVPMVTSHRLFCLDRHTGRILWLYEHPRRSAIINPAIALGDGRVYFVESRSPDALARREGRARLAVLLAKGTTQLIALDQTTGQEVWRRGVELSAMRHALYLCYSGGTLLITGTYNQDDHPRYDLLAFQAADGRSKWKNCYIRTDKPAGGDHGEQDQHPVIVGNTVFSRPAAFDLETGDRLPFELDRGGHGCGAISGSESYLFGRGANPRMYPISSGGRTSTALTTVTRPGCWINMIPAGGVLSIPEGSSGCSCAFSLQTSIVFAPGGGSE